MLDATLVSLQRLAVILALSFVAVSCGTGDGENPINATVCTGPGDIAFSQGKYLPTTGAKITVTDPCRPLETVSYKLDNGTSTINISVTLNTQSDGIVNVNFGATNAATRTIAANVGDVLTASYTDTFGNVHQDTATITAALATGVYSETNTDPALPVAELVTRIPGGKLTAVDDDFQDPLVTPHDGLVSLEAVYDTGQPGGNANGFRFDFGPPGLTNASFELPDASAGDVSCSTDWSCFNSSFTASSEFMPGGPGTFASPGARTGSQLLKMFNNDAIATQSIPVRLGDVVNASIYAISWSGDAFTQRAIVELRFFDAFGSLLPNTQTAIVLSTDDAGADYVLEPQDGADITDWTRIEVSGVAPIKAATAQLFILHQYLIPTAPAASAIFWDDAQLAVSPGAAGEDLSVFDVLRFALNTTAAPGLQELEISIEDAASGSGTVLLSAAPAPTPDATNPDWNLYEIPLASFGAGLDWTRITSLGFRNASGTAGDPAALTDATLYFDDINFAVGAPLPPAAAPVMTGILLNSPMQGVTYSTPTRTGVTNALGEFEYIEGELVTFSIGGITLGAITGDDIITPVELTGSLDPSTQRVINMLVFLQSIDDDAGTPGIQVTASMRANAASLMLNFVTGFSANVQGVVDTIMGAPTTLVDETTALDNFYATYVAQNGTQTFDWLFPGYDPVGESGFDLVWFDEFSVDGAPSDYWTLETGYGSNGWGNDEWQLYTNDPQNVAVTDGNLVITARCSTYPTDNCADETANKRQGTITSARINTSGTFSVKYGKIKARIKPPGGAGAWSAFWMLGAEFPTTPWPLVGEIDIMEFVPNISNRTTLFTIHWCDESLPTYSTAPPNCFPAPKGYTLDSRQTQLDDPLDEDFHVFEAQWDENGIHGFIDGIQYFSRDIDPGTMEEFLEEFFLILNVAIGGNLGGAPDTTTTWPQTMLVDYVRVYQPTGGNGTATIVPPASTVSGAQTTITPASAGADAGSPVVITVQAKDAGGIDIPVSAGTVTLTATATSGTAVVSDYVDLDNGSYTFNLTNQTASQVTISGSIDAGGTIIPITAQALVDFVPGPVSGAVPPPAGAGTTITANNTSLALNQTATITVQAKDQYGNLITDNAGTLTLAITPDDTATTATLTDNGYQGNGIYQWTLTASAPQSYVVSGSFDTSTGVRNVGIVAIGDTVNVEFTGNPISGADSRIATNPDPLPAPPAAGTGVDVQVQAVNDIGVDVTTCNAEVELFVSSTSGQARIDGATVANAVISNCTSGLYTATISNTVAETVTVTGEIANQNVGAGNPTAVDIIFVPGPVDADQTTIGAVPASAASNDIDSITITVQAIDAFMNPITDDVGTLTLSIVPDDTGPTGTATLTDDGYQGSGSYQWTLTASAPENYTVSGSFDTTTGVVNIGNVDITATVDVSFVPPVGLFSDTNSDTEVSYRDIDDSVTDPLLGVCNQTIVAVDMATVFEGPDSLSATYVSGGTCNGFEFNFDFSGAAFTYSQDFESLDIGSATALSGDGYLYFADVWVHQVGLDPPPPPTNFVIYNYGPLGAPNGGPAFSAIATGEGVPGAQDDQYLNIYSDYDNQDHGNGGTNAVNCALDGVDGCIINTSVFREGTIAAGDIGSRWRLSFDYKAPFQCGIAQDPNCGGDGAPGGGDDFAINDSMASAFIVTLDPFNGFNRTNNVRFDTTAASNTDWASTSITIDLGDPLLEGQILQFGFNTAATLFQDSGVYYDNLVFESLPADISTYARMVFAINDATGTLADLEIRFKDTDGDTGSLFLAADAAVVVPTDGNNWTVYQVDLTGAGLVAGGLDPDKLVSLGFYNATDTAGDPSQLIDATLYFDDIHFIQ